MPRQGWKPQLATIDTQERPVSQRPWLAVAEEHAEEAVKLFVSVMNDPNQSTKLRLDAATKIAQLSGATYRGERKDGTGRPAANHLGSGTTQRQGRSHTELREILSAKLPPGSVRTRPEEIAKGEAVVVLADAAHNRKPTGHVVQDEVGKLVIKES